MAYLSTSSYDTSTTSTMMLGGFLAAVAIAYAVTVPEPVARVIERFRESMRRLRELGAAFAAAGALRAASFVRAPLPASLAMVLAWAAFLLAPGTAHADVGTALSSGVTGLEALLLGGGSAVFAVVLVNKLGPWLFGKGAAEVPALTAKLDTLISGSAMGKADPSDAEIEAHAVNQLGSDLSDSLNAIGESLATIHTLDKATLLGVLSSTEKKFVANIDQGSLESALGALGNQLLGGTTGWASGKLLALVHGHQVTAAIASTATPTAPSEKVAIAAPSGRTIVAPAPAAATPAPVVPVQKQGGSASFGVSFALMVVGMLLALATSGCAFFTPALKASIAGCQVSSATAQEGLLQNLVAKALTGGVTAAEAAAKLDAIEATGAFLVDDVDCTAAAVAAAVTAGGGPQAVVAQAAVELHLAKHNRTAVPVPAS